MEHYVRAIHKPTQVPGESIITKSPVKLSTYLSTLSITPPNHLREAFASYRCERRIGKPNATSPNSPPISSSSVEHKTYNKFYRPSYYPPIRRVNVTQRLKSPPNIKAAKLDMGREILIERIDNQMSVSPNLHTSKPWKELMDCEICCNNEDESSDMHEN